VFNKVILIGRLTRDPELRFLPSSGTPVTTFTIAVSRNYLNQSGEREADFIPIVVWRKLAEICANNLTKGRLIAVEGRIQTRSYDDKSGTRRYVTEVVAEDIRFLDRPKAERQNSSVNIDEDVFADLPEGFMPIDEDEVPF